MVDLTTDRWERTATARARTTIRPWMGGLLVVALIGAIVLGLRGLVALDQATAMSLWCALAALIAFGVLRRAIASTATRPGRDTTGHSKPVLSRDGTRLHHDARRHRRFVPARRATVLHLRDGRQIPAKIVDISIAGVAVEAILTDLEFLSIARVGSRVAGPVRQTRTGAVFGFESLLDPQPFDTSFVL